MKDVIVTAGMPSQPQITDKEFKAIANLVLREAGIALTPHKRALVIARLSGRVRDLGLPSFGDYYERVLEDPAELGRLLDRITTHETRFFREARHFALLEDAPYRRWKTRRHGPKLLRFLSAGCSTGEEAFSMAMSARYHFPPEAGWTVEVVAIDISLGTLTQARAATWSIDKAKDIPEPYKKAFMLQGVGAHASRMRASRELRSIVHFRCANLNHDSCLALGLFDVIFCCNVLMYFDSEARRRAISRLLARIKTDGLLFLGHAESLTGFEERVYCMAPNAYSLAPQTVDRR
jgi:chemotaxis protein methyltransferase CheR